ncbi:MAG: hypothetical protein ACNS60_15980 [Candidatus Cyclobacteriaceae bacterium M2_1C_046]
MFKKRIVVYPKDVQRITGRTEKYGRKLLKQIKEELGKEEHHYITIDEFSQYTGIDRQVLYEYIY